jgi:hypothetical protein
MRGRERVLGRAGIWEELSKMGTMGLGIGIGLGRYGLTAFRGIMATWVGIRFQEGVRYLGGVVRALN